MIESRNENLYLPNFTVILPLPKIDSVITNNQIKTVKSLHQRKFRQKYNKFIAEGDKIGEEILRNSTYEIDTIYANSEWLVDHSDALRDIADKIVEVDQSAMSKISHLVTPSPVLFVLNQNAQSKVVETKPASRIIYLDDVQDPGNVGTIIRIADWFGIRSVVRSMGSADFYNPKVIQATMGSFLNVSLQTSVFADLELPTHTTVGASMSGSDVSTFEWPSDCVLVMGNEGKGISAVVHQELDHHVTIPGSDERVAESLNVSMACGILTASMMK